MEHQWGATTIHSKVTTPTGSLQDPAAPLSSPSPHCLHWKLVAKSVVKHDSGRLSLAMCAPTTVVCSSFGLWGTGPGFV